MNFKVIIVLVAGVCGFVWLSNVRAQRMPAAKEGAITWMTDAPAALTKARTENKIVLIDFTGSDWCGWCIRLDEEVFSTEAFATYAQTNAVLLKLDFPQKKKLPAAEAAQNEKLAHKYGITGFPTIVVLKPNGEEQGRLGYVPGGPKAWLAALQALR